MILYTVAIVLVHVMLAVQARYPVQRSRPADDIVALCMGKQVALRSVPELEHLSSIVGSSNCSSNVNAAIPDLLNLIRQTERDLCAQESIDKLLEFYSKYLDTSAEENKQREELPKSLRKFALAYGMQMSNSCKKRMVDVLTRQGHDVLYTQAHEAVRNLVSDKSPVADMLEGLAGPDEILLPGDLAPYIKHKQGEQDKGIYVQSATGPYIRELQENCNKVFAPIYRPLIKPIVQLANMGFDYKDEPLRCHLDCSQTSSELAEWSRLVFLCETLNNIHMVDVSDKPNSEDTQTVRILTKEEAAVLDHKSVSELEVAEHAYGPVVLHDHLIFNKYDKKLKKAIRAFSTSKSESEKVARRVMGKGVSMFRSQLRLHKIGLMFSTGYKSLVSRIRTGEKLIPNDEIVKVLDGVAGPELEHSGPQSMWETTKNIGTLLAGVVKVILYIAIVLSLGSFWVLDRILFNGHIIKALLPYSDDRL